MGWVQASQLVLRFYNAAQQPPNLSFGTWDSIRSVTVIKDVCRGLKVSELPDRSTRDKLSLRRATRPSTGRRFAPCLRGATAALWLWSSTAMRCRRCVALHREGGRQGGACDWTVPCLLRVWRQVSIQRRDFRGQKVLAIPCVKEAKWKHQEKALRKRYAFTAAPLG